MFMEGFPWVQIIKGLAEEDPDEKLNIERLWIELMAKDCASHLYYKTRGPSQEG